jgi:M6 family metalloprotease-like protein
VASYFSQQSYGKYTIAGCDVHDWVPADNTEAYYSYGKYGRVSNAEIQKIFHPALNKLDQEAVSSGQTSFWSQYDSDNDYNIDIVLALHSGYGAEFGMKDCTNNREPINRIQSQAWNGYTVDGWVSSTTTFGYGLQGFVVLAGLDRWCDSMPAATGKMAHELTHTLTGSVPDLYDMTGAGGGAGGYDIMSNAYGPTGKNGNAPGSMSPWTKMRLSWITPTEITADGDCTYCSTWQEHACL